MKLKPRSLSPAVAQLRLVRPRAGPHTSGELMFDHVKFGVSDYAASKAFFLKALEPLGVAVVSEGPPTYGVELSPKGKASLCLYQTEEKPAHLHLAFTARIAGAAIGGTSAGPDIAAAGIGATAGYGARTD